MPRFAILIHDHPSLHWDFLLEEGDSCRTWRLLKSPDSPGEIPAEAIGDHRLMYLDYEGSVSGHRGTVARWDAGTFKWLTPTESLASNISHCEVSLSGKRFNGTARLNRRDEGAYVWTFVANAHDNS
jgi:DNA polymerase Ligase (LigD)